MRNYRKSVLLLAVVLFFSALVSCKTNNGGGSLPDIADSDMIYIPEYVNLPDEVTDMRSPLLLADIIYFFQPGITALQLYQVNTDGSGLKNLDGYEPKTDTQYISAVTPISDGTALIAENGETGCFLRKISLSDGAVLSEIDLTYLGSDVSVTSAAVDLNGNIAIAIADRNQELTIYAFSSGGEALFDETIKRGSMRLIRLLSLQDGSVTAAVIDLQANALRLLPVDMSNLQLGDSVGSFQINADNIVVTGIGLLIQTSDGIVGFEAGESQPTQFIDWLDSDMSSDGLTLLGASGGDIILFQSGSISEEKSANSIVTLREGSASDDRITLELGCLYLNYRLKNLIVQFNQTDPDYRIKVTEYAPGYPEVNLDLDTALMKMNTDLIAGNIPDILCLNEEMPFSAYAARGLFEDLTPYLSAEPEYKLVKAAETALKSADGKLYRIAKAFDILTYVGDSEIVGDEPGWTFKDVDSALASNPGKQLFLDSATQSSALNVIIRINLPDYIDWSTGDVNIDSPDFIKLLEWAKSFPTGKYTSISSVPGYSDGELLGMSTKIDSFKEFLVYNAITEDRISFKGFPSDTRQGSTLWVVDTPLSMSAKCSHKDGAWRFMKNILTEEYYCPPGSISMGFPIVQSIFDNEIQKAMTENYDERNIITRYFYDTMGSGDNGIGDDKALNTDTLYPTGQITIYGETEEKYIEFYAMTEQQIERFMEFLNSITRTMEYDQTLADIVTEECAAFFAGDKSAEETARLIQSRVLIYVNEQM